MRTFAKAGRIALLHLFEGKKVIFNTTRYEEMGIVRVLPRKVYISKEVIDLEKEYLGHMVGVLGRENNYKIFFWGVEMGLTEILLVSDENEGKLSDLLCKFVGGTITHIVIAEKEEWDSPWGDWKTRKEFAEKGVDMSQPCSMERVTIYSLTEEQKGHLANRIHNKELDMIESEEEFIFHHGYFPVK